MSQAAKYCPTCGAENELASRFCAECGASFAVAPAAPATPPPAAYAAPHAAPPAERKPRRIGCIIVVVVLLCICVGTLVAAWFYGDQILELLWPYLQPYIG